MAKITRVLQKIFGIDSGATGTTVFGSTAGGATQYSKDVGNIQSPAFEDGWLSAILAGVKRLPTYEDMNSIHYVCTSQLAYILQEGIPEYDSETTYYQYSIVKQTNTYKLYGSLTDNNQGNVLTNPTHWKLLIDLENAQTNINLIVKTDNYVLLTGDIGKCFVMNSATAKAFTLPSVFDGGYYYLKNIGSGTCTITPAGGNTVETASLIQNQAVFLVADVSNNRWRSIAFFNVQATETAPGLSEIATQTEVNTGSDTIRYVTPATLSGRTATETRTGVSEIATLAEVQAKVDTTRYVTPATYWGSMPAGSPFNLVHFGSNGTYIPSAGTRFIWFVLGGGGGGSTLTPAAGGSGGGGATVFGWLNVSPGTNGTVTIGASKASHDPAYSGSASTFTYPHPTEGTSSMSCPGGGAGGTNAAQQWSAAPTISGPALETTEWHWGGGCEALGYSCGAAGTGGGVSASRGNASAPGCGGITGGGASGAGFLDIHEFK